MADTITIKFKVMEDGSLKAISQQADKAADSVDKVGKSARTTDRNLKGTAQMTSNATKSFSKMSQGITGGLVPAYATLAANVFALSAAFNFFKRASDVAILERSQVQYATNTGLALQSITKGLRDASGGMLGFREAAEAAAIGVAKGFSPQQLEDLADGARKASSALGRNFEDAFDRLIRGASKAEPELLDELGITLRLKTATESYAKALGVQADALTASQRSQAVLLETQKQLDELFGKGVAETNPFVVLAKTFEDLTRAGTNALMPMITSIVDIINKSGIAAIAVFGALGLSIFKAAIPMDSIGEKLKKFVDKSAEGTKKAIQNQKDYEKQVRESEEALKDLAKSEAQKSAQTAMDAGAGGSKLVRRAAGGEDLTPQNRGRLKKMLKDAEAQYKKHGKIVSGTFKGMNIEIVRNMKSSVDKMSKSPVPFGKKMGVLFKKIKLQGKVAFSTLKERGTKTLEGLGDLAKSAGERIGKAMKFAGIIGGLVMIAQVVKKLLSAPFTIVSNLLQGLDAMINFIMPMIKTPVMAVANSMDFILNKLKGFVNIYIGMYNKIAGSFVGEKLGLKTITALNTKTNTMADAAERLTSGTVSTQQAFAQSGAGDFLLKMENGATIINNQEQALKNYQETYKKMGEDVTNAVKGMTSSTNNLSKAQKGELQVTTLGSLGLADRIKKIKETTKVLDKNGNVIEHNTLTQEQQKVALADLRREMRDLKILSPEMAEALAKNEPNVELIENLEINARNATTEMKSFRDAIEGVTSAMASGDLSSTEYLLNDMARSAESAMESFNRIGTPEALAKAVELQKEYDKALGDDKNTTQYHQNLIALRKETEAHNLAVEFTNLLAGQRKLIRDAENSAMSTTLELKHIETQLEGDLNDKLRDQLELKAKLLGIKLKEQEAKVVDATQGEFMGAAVRSAEIAAGEAGTILGGEKLADERRTELTGVETEIASVQKAKETTTDEEELNNLQQRLDNLTGQAATLKDQIKVGESATMGDKIGAVADMASPMAEQLAKLGPEGEAMSTAIMGAMSLGETFSNVFDSMKDKTMTFEQGLGAAASAIGAIQSMQAAKSKAAVAGIDKEIAAEKARDGKSKGSLAKIAAMEKKKDAIKRKAFEQDKKMKMAQVVMATAQAAIQAASAPPGLPWTAPFVAMAIAMGAAQLAAISSTSYQGGASGAGAGAPSEIAIGDRKNKVDLANARNMAGEQAYMRGQAGIGTGMSDYTSAFTGYKNRAGGGAFGGIFGKGVMVGEQGPELLTRDLSVISAPETEAAIDGSNPVNINFSVSTIDSSDMQQTLETQRANIIGMIREAAHSTGQTFLEGVDAQEY